MRSKIILSLIAVLFIGAAGFAFAAEEESYTERVQRALIDLGIMGEERDPSYMDKLKASLGELGIIDEESKKWTYLGKDLYKREFDDGIICYAYGTTRECVKPGLFSWFTGYKIKLNDRGK